MPEPSITPGDNPNNDDAAADSTTVTDPQPGTDSQPDPNKDQQPDDASKSTDKSADDDKTPTANSDNTDDKDKKDDTPASFDEDLDEWITKRGLAAPTDDKQKQAYQDLRNSQREYTREQQAKKDAADLASTIDAEKSANKTGEEEDDEDDDTEKRLKAVEADREYERTTRLQSEFYSSNKVTPEQHKGILDLIKEKVARASTPEAKLSALNLWGHPDQLPDLLDTVKGRLTSATDTSAVEDEAARKERERIARESNANSPNRSASSTTTPDLSEDEARRKRFEERYKK